MSESEDALCRHRNTADTSVGLRRMSLVYLRAQSRSMLLLKEGPQSAEPLSTGQCPSAAPSPRRIRRVVARSTDYRRSRIQQIERYRSGQRPQRADNGEGHRTSVLTTHTCSGDLRSSPSHPPCLARDSSLPRTPEPRQRYRAPEYDMPPLRIGVHASIAAGPLRLVEMAVRGVASPSARAALQRRAPRARLQQLSIRPYIQVVSRSMWKRYRDGSSGCLRQSHSFSVGVLYWSAYRSPRTRVVRQRRHRGRGTSSLTQRLA